MKKNIRDSYTLAPLGEFIELLTGGSSPDTRPVVYVLTGFRGAGRAALEAPEVFGDAAQEMGLNRFYVLPSSVDELLLLDPDGFTPAELAELVHSVNVSMVPVADRLPEVIRMYDRGNLVEC